MSGDRPATPADRLRAGADLLPPAGRLLDVGCGDGSLATLLNGKAKLVLGVDGTWVSCRQARTRGVLAQCADLNGRLPYRDEAFDAIACLDVIEHVMDPRHLLREVGRLLRPRGVLVLTTPNIRFYPFIARLLLTGKFPRTSGDPRGYDGGHLHYFTFADVRQLLREAGFGPVEEFGLYRWTSLSAWGRMKEAVKALLGDRLKREFFSGAVVVRASRSAA